MVRRRRQWAKCAGIAALLGPSRWLNADRMHPKGGPTRGTLAQRCIWAQWFLIAVNRYAFSQHNTLLNSNNLVVF